MKRKLFCLFFICVLLAGCGKKSEPQNTESVPQGGEEATVDDGGSLQYILPGSSLTGNKILSADGLEIDSTLRLVNTETGEKTLVLNVSARINVYMGDGVYYTQAEGIAYPFLYNGRVYVVVSRITEDSDGNPEAVLYSMSSEQNGSDLQECFSFGKCTAIAYLKAVRVEEKLYVPIQYRESGNSYFTVYEYDLSSGEGKEIFRSGEGYYGYQMCYTDGKLAVGYTTEEYDLLYAAPDELNACWKVPNQDSYISVIDLEGKEETAEYTEDWKLLGSNNEKLLVWSSDFTKCCWLDPETGELTESVVQDFICMVYQYDEGVIVGCTSGEDGNYKNKYYIFRSGKSEPEEWISADEEYNFWIECAGNEKLFIAWVPARKEYSEEDYKYEFVDKAEFLQ